MNNLCLKCEHWKQDEKSYNVYIGERENIEKIRCLSSFPLKGDYED
jgi:hypothetical protein